MAYIFCMASFLTIMPPDWTTIVTGAWIGAHGMTCFNMHKEGRDFREKRLADGHCANHMLFNEASNTQKR